VRLHVLCESVLEGADEEVRRGERWKNREEEKKAEEYRRGKRTGDD